MLLLNPSPGGGWYLTIGTFLHRALEIGYQFYDRNYFDISISYIPQGRPLSGIKFSVSFFKWFIECNLYDTRFHLEMDKVFTDDENIKVEEKIEASTISLEKLSSIIPKQEETLEIDETYSFSELGQEIATISDPPISKVIVEKNLSLAQLEFNEYGNIALRRWAGSEEGGDVLIDDSMNLHTGSTVLIRAKDGGFHFLDLHCDEDGWYVNHPNDIHIVNVVFDRTRKLWVVEEMI